jgi:hypothetical protein
VFSKIINPRDLLDSIIGANGGWINIFFGRSETIYTFSNPPWRICDEDKKKAFSSDKIELEKKERLKMSVTRD